MKKLLTTILAVCTAYVATAQAPEIEWQKSYGGVESADMARSAQQTADGGYIIAGYAASGDITDNHGGYDYFIVKTDAAGITQWQKSFGGSNNDYAYSIRQTIDGGYIVAGSSSSNNGDVIGNHGQEDYWIAKVDNTGNLQWQKSYGGSGNDIAYSIEQTSDGGFIVVGETRSTDGDVTGNHGLNDYWVLKLDNAGNLQWHKTFGGSGNDIGYSIKQTSDGGYVIAGKSASTDGDVIGNDGGFKGWIIKLSTSGNIQWQKLFTSTALNAEIYQTTDSGYIFVSGNVVGKLNATGNIQWETNVSADLNGVDQDGDGGFIATGKHYSSNKYYVVKLNTSGGIVWEKEIGGSFGDEAYSIQHTTDGGYIIAGASWSNDGDIEGWTGCDDCIHYWVVKLKGNLTSIPDHAFEQRLIDLGLDDVLDGYVQTSNISDVTQLDVSNRNISDLTGIEDFASLLSLNCSSNQLTSLIFGDGAGGKGTNFTTDFGLEYLNASGNQLTSLDVSGLASLTTFLVNNNALTALNVQNGNNINFTAFNATNNPDLLCIQVDDADWSTTNWTNIDPQTGFNEDCANMSVTDQQLSQLEIYPNPAKDVVHFNKPISGQLFNATGLKVMAFENATSVNVSELPKGIYVLVTSKKETRKLILK